MKYEAFKELVIAAAKARGLADYELYYSGSESTSVEIFKEEVKEFSSSKEGGVCFRCLADGRMGYASTEDLSEAEAEAIVERAAENAAALETTDKEFLAEAGGEYRKIAQKAVELPGAAELVDLALDCQKRLYGADKAVTDGTEAEAVTATFEVAICNSNGLDLKQENKALILVAAPAVTDGKEMYNSYEIVHGPLTEEKIDKAVKKSVEDAMKKLGAGVAPTGASPVILAPEAVRSMLAVYSFALSADAAQKGLSRFAGKEGEAVAAEIVTLIDDPFYPEAAVNMPFDAEGMQTCTKAVIENGRLNTLLYDLKTAAAAGKTSTGNAAKASYRSPVGIQPFTLYMKAGDKTEDELLAMADGGVYIDFLGGLHAGADPISGDFSLQCEGFMIRDGKKAEAVKNFTVAGNFFEMIKNIRAIGSEVKMQQFGAGVTGFAAPAVLADGLSVAGK